MTYLLLGVIDWILGLLELIPIFLLLKGHRFLCKVQTALRQVLVEVFTEVFASCWIRIERLAREWPNLHLTVSQVVLDFSLNPIYGREHGGGLRSELVRLLYVELLRVLHHGLLRYFG